MYGSRSLCLRRRFLSFLPFLPPLVAFIWIFPAFRRECKFPTLGAWRASCSSWVFFIFEGACELVVLSIGNEPSLFDITYCISNIFDGQQGIIYVCLVIYCLPIFVQRAPMAVKPVSCPFIPCCRLWSDPDCKILGLSCLPPGHATGVASGPHFMVVDLLSGIKFVSDLCCACSDFLYSTNSAHCSL